MRTYIRFRFRCLVIWNASWLFYSKQEEKVDKREKKTLNPPRGGELMQTSSGSWSFLRDVCTHLLFLHLYYLKNKNNR